MRYALLRAMSVALLGAALAACGGGQTREQAREERVAQTPELQETTVAGSREASSSQTAAPSAVATSQVPGATATAQPEAPAAFDPSRVRLALEQVAEGFDRPLFVTHDADGNLFVVEKGGTVQVFPGGDFAAEPRLFLDISDRVRASGSEQGLLGMALHPRFHENGYSYVNYIDSGGDTVIARFGPGAERLTADADSELVLLRQDQPASNHNGGMLAFGPDGYLYIGLGDGGGANDQFGNGQNLESLLGKLLRIDVDGGQPYAIPANNPFAQDGAAEPEIWAYGLRNPWRFSFDRETGDLYIGDVGQNRYEYIHFQPADSAGGQNFGWPILEGTHCFRAESCDRAGLTPAVVDYPHDLGCTVVGGYVYRGTRFPLLRGAYIFGDYCSGRMWTMARDAAGAWQMHEALLSDVHISSFGEDAAGEIYGTDLASGRLFRVTAVAQ